MRAVVTLTPDGHCLVGNRLVLAHAHTRPKTVVSRRDNCATRANNILVFGPPPRYCDGFHFLEDVIEQQIIPSLAAGYKVNGCEVSSSLDFGAIV